MSDYADPRDDAIVVGARHDQNETRWGMILVLFMRMLAIVWIMQGLVQWRIILTPAGVFFDYMSRTSGIAVCAFAMFDLVAAIGLWLAAPWGGVIWLLVVLAQISVAIMEPGFFAGGFLFVALDMVLIVIYLILTWQAGHDPRHARNALLMGRRSSSSGRYKFNRK